MVTISTDAQAACRNCRHWKYEEERRDGRKLGTCALSPSCICCNDGILFGANGGGTFLSEASFLCKFYKSNSEVENANQSHS